MCDKIDDVRNVEKRMNLELLNEHKSVYTDY